MVEKSSMVPVCMSDAIRQYIGMPATAVTAGDAVTPGDAEPSEIFDERYFSFGAFNCLYYGYDIVGYTRFGELEDFLKRYNSLKASGVKPFVRYRIDEDSIYLLIVLGSVEFIEPFAPSQKDEKPVVPREKGSQLGHQKIKEVNARHHGQPADGAPAFLKAWDKDVEHKPAIPPQFEAELSKKGRLFKRAKSVSMEHPEANRLLESMQDSEDPVKVFKDWPSLDAKYVMAKELVSKIVSGDADSALKTLDTVKLLPEDNVRKVLRSALYEYGKITSKDVKIKLFETFKEHFSIDDIVPIVDKLLLEDDEEVLAAALKMAEEVYADVPKEVCSSGVTNWAGVATQLLNRQDKIRDKVAGITHAKNRSLRMMAYVLAGLLWTTGVDGLESVLEEGAKVPDPDIRLIVMMARKAGKMSNIFDFKVIRNAVGEQEMLWFNKNVQDGKKGGLLYGILILLSSLPIMSPSDLMSKRKEYEEHLAVLEAGFEGLSEDNQLNALKSMKALGVYSERFAENIVEMLPQASERLKRAYLDFLEYQGVPIHHSVIFVHNRRKLEDVYKSATDAVIKQKLGLLMFASGITGYIDDFLKGYLVDEDDTRSRIFHKFALSKMSDDFLQSQIDSSAEFGHDVGVAGGLISLVWGSRPGLHMEPDQYVKMLAAADAGVAKMALDHINSEIESNPQLIMGQLKEMWDHKDVEVRKRAMLQYAIYLGSQVDNPAWKAELKWCRDVVAKALKLSKNRGLTNTLRLMTVHLKMHDDPSSDEPSSNN